MPNARETRVRYGRAGLRVGDVLGRWTLVEFVKSGGNGDVWFAESGGDDAALKVLHRLRHDDDYERFSREVDVCQRIDSNTIAILPIIDVHLPAKPSMEPSAAER